MSNSIPVVAGNAGKASDYNNLRLDVLDPSTGHTHNGVDSKVLSLASATAYASAQTRVISIGCADFNPTSASSAYTKSLNLIQGGSGTELMCNLKLPQGAIVTKLTGNFFNDSGSSTHQVLISLKQITNTSTGNVNMAVVSNYNTSGYETNSQSSISYATIDNENYNYIIDLGFTTTKGAFVSVQIEYTVLDPLP